MGADLAEPPLIAVSSLEIQIGKVLWSFLGNRGFGKVRSDFNDFPHSPRAICTVLLDPRDPLLQSERTQGFAADPDYWKSEVFAYVGRNQNLKDLKDPGVCVSIATIGIPSDTPLEDHPSPTHREPSALYCWILEILDCNPKGRRALLRIPSRANCLPVLGGIKT